jgi:microcystin-dependent protein
MSDQIVELKHLRGTQAQKDVSSRVPAEAQIAVVTDEQYAVLGDGATAISALRPMEDRRVQTGDHTATETVTDVGASIVAIDTTTDSGTVQLPTLSANVGRRIYIININAGNSITINAEGSDTIGAAGDTSIEVGADVTTTIMVGTATYWEQVATGGGAGGGGGMEIGTIFPYAGTVAPIGSFLCDGSAVSRTEYADLFAAIGTTWGVGDGSTTFNLPDLRGAFVRGTGSHGSETMADGNPFAGPAVGAFEDDQMQGHYHSVQRFNAGGSDSGLAGAADRATPGSAISIPDTYDYVTDAKADGTNGTPRTGDETRPFAAGVTYCIKATPATNSGTPLPTYSYSTGWVANSDWTNAEFTVTHGLNADLTGLLVEVWLSTDGTEANARQVYTGQRLSNVGERVIGAGLTAIGTGSFTVQTGADGIYYGLDNTGAATFWGASTSGYYKVNVYRPEVLATELSVQKYDTGWVANSDWTNAEFNITHNLGISLSEAIVQFSISTDGTDVNSYKPALVGFNSSDTTLRSGGVTLFQTNNNAIKVQTGKQGIYYTNDSGSNAVLDTQSQYYRVVVYAPNLLENATPAAVKSVSSDYTITGRTDSLSYLATTGASDLTLTLPAGSSMTPGDTIDATKVDAGAGKLIVSRAGSDTIDGVTTIDIDSQYDYAKLRWSGAHWTLVEYKDHGSNANGEWVRYADGTMSVSISTTATNPVTSFSWPVTFTDTPKALATPVASADRVAFFQAISVSEYTVKTLRPDNAAATSNDVSIFATGRWRA